MRFPLRQFFPRFLALACIAWVLPLAAQPAGAPEPAEYMIYQYPGMTLVVVVDVREAEFHARITGPEGALVSEAGVPGRRVGPVYQYIGPVDTPRQLMVDVHPEVNVERSRISMELLQFPRHDPNAQLQARAFQALAHGMKRVGQPAGAVWAERSYSLRNAARAFASIGDERMQLWSEYYAAHLALHGIGDVLMARERAAAVSAAARRAGLPRIELLATVLQAESLMVEAEQSGGEQGERRLAQVHPLWDQVAVMAEIQGLEVERGRALYRDGIAYERQGRPDAAIERYEQALSVIVPGTDQDLLNDVRATAAAAYERSGRTGGALGLLEDITGDLSRQGEAEMALELAHNLYEKGRLLNDTFRYAEAAGVLERSLELQKAHAGAVPWGPTGLELGRTRYALGEWNAARRSLAEALPRTPGLRSARRYAALGAMASIAREQGRHEEAQELRERQRRSVEDDRRAEWLFETALDARARGYEGEARRLFREAGQAARGSDLLTGHRAGLYLCGLEPECGPGQARASVQALEASGLPSLEVEAGLLWVGLLERQRRSGEARDQVDRLLDSVQFYRERLPGVIANWYAARRGELYRTALRLARDVSAYESLRMLERIRRLEATVADGGKPEDALRATLHRVRAAQPTAGDEYSRLAHDALRGYRSRSGWDNRIPSIEGIRDGLARLGSDTSLVAFDFSGDRVHAVVASPGGARLHRLADSAAVGARLDAAWSTLQEDGATRTDVLDRLGEDLVAPFATELGDILVLMPSGPLSGFPLHTLRLGGQSLAERFRMVNTDSLPGAGTLLAPLSGAQDRQVFLAGNPRAGRELFSYGVSTSREIDAVRDRFVGGGLHIVQGVALREDEFRDGRYANASLVHLAMPGRVDLERPERSRLLLSGERESPTAEFLTPADLRSIPLRAELAVLGGTAFMGRSQAGFASRLGLVHDLHDAGAPRVVASLWPLDDERAARFMQVFYGHLEREKSAIEALYLTRRTFLDSENGDNLARWAGFQLFIR